MTKEEKKRKDGKMSDREDSDVKARGVNLEHKKTDEGIGRRVNDIAQEEEQKDLEEDLSKMTWPEWWSWKIKKTRRYWT